MNCAYDRSSSIATAVSPAPQMLTRPYRISLRFISFAIVVTIAEFQELEKANLIAALQCANWKIWGPGGAADLLAMKPSTLTYQMKVLGVAKHSVRN